jgi:hypothetical protein
MPERAKEERGRGTAIPSRTLICHAGGSKVVTALQHVLIALGY